MALTPDERQLLSTAIQQRRRTKFGTAKAAYEAAGVSSATWEKAEAGGSIREDRMIAIVRTLWPETEGDWQKVPSVGGSVEPHQQYVSSSVSEQVEGGKQDAEVLRAITSMSAALDQLVTGQRHLAERVDVGQQSLVERVDAVAAGSEARFAALEAGFRELSERMEQLEEPGP